jgi:hypothetical protein
VKKRIYWQSKREKRTSTPFINAKQKDETNSYKLIRRANQNLPPKIIVDATIYKSKTKDRTYETQKS